MKISDLQPKDNVQSIFLIKYIAVMESRDGKKYLNAILGDRTGTIEARMWHGAEEIASLIEKGAFVKIAGKVNSFQSRLQVIIQKIEKANQDEFDPEDFIQKSKNKPDEMLDKLIQMADSLEDLYIKDLLLAILNDQDIVGRLKLWPAGKSIHHAYQSGLLEHLLSCTELGNTLSKHYNLSRDFVIAGCILHDICKIYELHNGPNVEYSDEGKLIGHVSRGQELLHYFTGRIRNFPRQTKIHLEHILIAHHGEYEFGASKLPQTKEAMLVHQIDLMDSKLHSFETAIAADNNQGNWTNFVKHLNRLIFKGELPIHKEYLPDRVDRTDKAGQEKPQHKKKQYKEKDLKQNMGSLLKGFNVKE